ncbi:hypothetical protein P5673_025084 [Acropora cervicornis]|uniref:Uncharacterized protein n=1 Tax=Acropora cervicornis TaxID=6130 RepID=A0AAD9UXP9_ACRCE|nr:hypothetical protein P5673_025084 [Acropora cervicornis]
METCICVYLSSFPSEVRKKFEQSKEQTWGLDETNYIYFLKIFKYPNRSYITIRTGTASALGTSPVLLVEGLPTLREPNDDLLLFTSSSLQSSRNQTGSPIALGIKVKSTSDPDNQPTEAIPSSATSGQPSTECINMTESVKEVASTDAISEL